MAYNVDALLLHYYANPPYVLYMYGKIFMETWYQALFLRILTRLFWSEWQKYQNAQTLFLIPSIECVCVYF